MVFEHQSTGQLALAPCLRGGTPLRDTREQAPGERVPCSGFLRVRWGDTAPSEGSESKTGTKEDSS